MGLTPKQKRILDFIESFAAVNGYSPSQQEIAQNFGFRSLGTVQNYLVRLEREGLLKKAWNARRGAQVLPLPRRSSTTTSPRSVEESAVPLPLLGRVAAGKPIEAITTAESFSVPPSFLRGDASAHFVLKVVGQSMKDDGILDGDYVVIRKSKTAENGQTVVALVNQEATIKRFYKKQGQIELHPANSDFKPLVLTPSEAIDFKIEGICAGVIRPFTGGFA